MEYKEAGGELPITVLTSKDGASCPQEHEQKNMS